ncbi:9806_t:CDS:1, partial [Scutellospora calospora]
SPTVRRVVEIVIQNPNLHKEMLADYKVKPIRFDEMKTFTIEIPDENNWSSE